jgi:hypothetical protein
MIEYKPVQKWQSRAFDVFTLRFGNHVVKVYSRNCAMVLETVGNIGKSNESRISRLCTRKICFLVVEKRVLLRCAPQKSLRVYSRTGQFCKFDDPCLEKKIDNK